MRGLHGIVCAIICAFVVGLSVEGGPVSALFNQFSSGGGGMIGGLFLPYLTGGVFGALMSATGSSEKFGRVLIRKFGTRFAPYALMIFVFILPMCGIASWMLLAAYLALPLLKAADLPRRLGAAILMGSFCIGYYIPGAMNTTNIIAVSAYGVTLYDGAQIMIPTGILFVGLLITYVELTVKHCRLVGEGYTPSPVELPGSVGELTEEEMPSFIMSVIPMIIVIVGTFICQLGFGVRGLRFLLD
ncbi:MAG: hypothetical protein LUE21_07800 [Oscillospiraceae bacterium]|nr:hypothetical protein [Oscillospiraceae bacterium]